MIIILYENYIMFKSLRWKITLLFITTMIIAEFITGSAAILFTAKYFNDDFAQATQAALDDGLRAELDNAANAITIPTPPADDSSPIVMMETSDINLQGIRDSMSAYLGKLAMSATRTYAILDGKTAELLYSSVNAASIEITPTVTRALEGEESFSNGLTAEYMVYGLPLGKPGNVKYILYIRDTKAVAKNVLKTIMRIWIFVMTGSALLAILIGFFMSKTITNPIRSLTDKAKRLADGDLNALEASKSTDELGALTNSLLYLAHSRKESNEKAKGEQIKVETILQNMNDGILAFNMQGKLIHINPEAQRLLHRKYLDDISFDRFFKEIQADITLGDLLYMKPDGSIEREVKI